MFDPLRLASSPPSFVDAAMFGAVGFPSDSEGPSASVVVPSPPLSNSFRASPRLCFFFFASDVAMSPHRVVLPARDISPFQDSTHA